MKNKIGVVILDSKYSGLKQSIGCTVDEFFRILKRKGIMVEVYVVGAREMRRINRDFRGKDKPTNVLSFSSVSKKIFFEPPMGVDRNLKDIGEVYICPSFIYKAKEDLRLMVIHGLLHLLGYDHETRSDRIKMQNLEKRLCQKILLSV